LRQREDVVDIDITNINHLMDWSLDIKRRTMMINLKLRIISLRRILSGLINDESGQDLIEYALVAAIIALGATAAMTTVSKDITAVFTKIGTSLASAT
jgi:pilus assembly protein Flp/PilA